LNQKTPIFPPHFSEKFKNHNIGPCNWQSICSRLHTMRQIDHWFSPEDVWNGLRRYDTSGIEMQYEREVISTLRHCWSKSSIKYWFELCCSLQNWVQCYFVDPQITECRFSNYRMSTFRYSKCSHQNVDILTLCTLSEPGLILCIWLSPIPWGAPNPYIPTGGSKAGSD
jgi:hypothetical protein